MVLPGADSTDLAQHGINLGRRRLGEVDDLGSESRAALGIFGRWPVRRRRLGLRLGLRLRQRRG